jgi:type I restriction-modification system DNA methylase subunit
MQFILNNLSFLEKGSYCIAIVPMSCALAQSGDRLALKQQLLEYHTLDAVLSMPNELFKNSNVGVNTCIMIFKAKEKHLNNYKTYFAYCKDDGFINKKTEGRADYSKMWNGIKKKWVDSFRNRDEIV